GEAGRRAVGQLRLGVLQAPVPRRQAAHHEEGDQPLALGTSPGSATGQSLRFRLWRLSPFRSPRPPALGGPAPSQLPHHRLWSAARAHSFSPALGQGSLISPAGAREIVPAPALG